MKKVIYGVLSVAVFGLTACDNDKKETFSSSKVELLESRVKELESSSGSEALSKEDEDNIFAEVQSSTNKKIVSAFLDNNLVMYNNESIGISETIDDPYDPNGFESYESGMTFYAEKNDIVLSVYTFANADAMKSAIELREQDENISLSKNEKIGSILFGYPTTNSEKDLFNKYKEVFESIQ